MRGLRHRQPGAAGPPCRRAPGRGGRSPEYTKTNIYIYIYIYIYTYIVYPRRSQNGHVSFSRQINTFNKSNKSTKTNVYIYIYICIYIHNNDNTHNNSNNNNDNNNNNDSNTDNHTALSARLFSCLKNFWTMV